MIGPKEAAYDEHFAPLVAKLIEFCKEHRINHLMMFSLDDGISCTTANNVLDESGEVADKIGRAYALLRGSTLSNSTITIIREVGHEDAP